jgi:myo-inositol 2-dehydrogenase / D-chiro-inositol 1-dehydrogenase
MLRVGIVGCGTMGQAHAKTIQDSVRGAEISAVCDVSYERVRTITDSISGLRTFTEYKEMIKSDEVTAVMVTVPASLHTDVILTAIEAGKPVFSEKPMADSAAECREIVEAEVAVGKRLVQVGFMKRYDRQINQIKEMIASGDLGAPLIVKAAQRSEKISEIYPYYSSEMQVTDAAIHEIDYLPWLLGGDEWVEVQSLSSRTSRHVPDGLQDPALFNLKTKGGILCQIEQFVNTKFLGYESTIEVVCEDGIINLPGPASPVVRSNHQVTIAIEKDWLVRFGESYRVQLQDWVDKAFQGTTGGTSAWDGYTAAVTADALLASQKSGRPEKVVTGDKPQLYLT